MNIAVTIISVIMSVVVCYFLGVGYVIDKYTEEEYERANNRSDSKVG